MGTIIDVPQAGLDLVLYGDKSNILKNYLYNQLQSIPQTFNEFSNRVYNAITTSYNFVNDKLTQYGILSKIKNSGLNVVNNYIEELLTFDQLQNANLVMQRWVMAHPQVKQMYIDQDIDGYSNTYVDISGKTVGDNDYNYRRVMDGVVVPTNDGWTVKHYIEDLLPGDQELDHFQKVKIINTWQAIDFFLETCQFDFTIKSDQPVKFNKN